MKSDSASALDTLELLCHRHYDESLEFQIGTGVAAPGVHGAGSPLALALAGDPA